MPEKREREGTKAGREERVSKKVGHKRTTLVYSFAPLAKRKKDKKEKVSCKSRKRESTSSKEK